MKPILLYSDENIELEEKENGIYRVTMFKDNHWHGDITFTKDLVLYDGITEERTIGEIDKMAHDYCMSAGYSNLDNEEYIPMGNTRWGDVIFDIEEAYKAGYRKAMEE